MASLTTSLESKKSCSSLNPFTPRSFRLPFNIKCVGCGSILAQSVIVDAEKEPLGFLDKYKSNACRITFKCCCCIQEIVLMKCPRYEIVGGCQKMPPFTCKC